MVSKKISSLEEDLSRIDKPNINVSKAFEKLELTAEKLNIELIDFETSKIGSPCLISIGYKKSLSNTQALVDGLMNRLHGIQQQCRLSSLPEQNTQLFKLIVLPDLHASAHAPPGLFSWVQFVTDDKEPPKKHLLSSFND